MLRAERVEVRHLRSMLDQSQRSLDEALRQLADSQSVRELLAGSNSFRLGNLIVQPISKLSAFARWALHW